MTWTCKRAVTGSRSKHFSDELREDASPCAECSGGREWAPGRPGQVSCNLPEFDAAPACHPASALQVVPSTTKRHRPSMSVEPWALAGGTGNEIGVNVLETGQLVFVWRQQAEFLRRLGAPAQADLLEKCAAELDAVLAVCEHGLLSLREASKVTGYSMSHLRRLVREKRIPRYQEGGEIRVRKGDLPRKPAAKVVNGARTCTSSRMQVARAVVSGE